jgi:putative endonuclease
MQKNHKIKAYKFGLIAEVFARLYLRIKFYKILAKRYKSPFGEIDIIAKKNNQIIFIEVKARENIGLMDFISARQQRRINKSAEYFISSKPKYRNYNIRFDAIIMNRYFWPKHFISYW